MSKLKPEKKEEDKGRGIKEKRMNRGDQNVAWNTGLKLCFYAAKTELNRAL